MSGRPVIVGVTGSPGSAAVTRWAAREALTRHRGLRLVHAAAYDTGDVPAWRRHARSVLSRATGGARGAAPGVNIEVAVHHESPIRVLTAAAAEAELLVLGAIGHGRPGDGPAEPILHSVLRAVRTPVAVVHAETVDRTGPVVVGVEDPAGDTEVLRVAHDYARCRGSDLQIVHALRPPAGRGDLAVQVTELARRWDSGQVAVHAEVIDDRALPALLHAARHAGLLVIGAHHTDGRPWIRSTTTALARSASCPVLIVPAGVSETTVRRPALDRRENCSAQRGVRTAETTGRS